jgi:2-C-methyl-D-erythritol 4-phosphate cytidylyltransferase
MLVGGLPLLVHTLRVFERAKGIQEIILVIPKEEEGQGRALIRDYSLKKISKVVFGGKTRQESVYAGLLATAPDVELVAVHDGARPLVTEEIINRTIARARELGGAIAAVPVLDTLKESSLDGCIKRTWDRHGFWLAQTPQTFRRKILLSAYEQAIAHNRIGTDEASLVEPLGYPVGLVEGSRENIKVTTPADLDMANYLLSIREAE